MAAEKPLVYLLLGAAGSGRREVVADLIVDGLTTDDRPATLLAESETACASDAKLGALARWRWTTEHKIEATLPAGATHVFFITDGRRNPVDQVEAFKDWLAATGAELGRIISVVHCQLVEKHHAMQPWYDACVHFSDVVLLNHRAGVANKWMSDFREHFAKQFMPCLFEFVKDGRVKNPVLILEPQARRISQAFDPVEETTGLDGEVIEIHDETADDSAEETDAEELDDTPQEDPYFARKPGGRRVKEIPDIAKFLDA